MSERFFTCEHCGDRDEPQNVHHSFYRKGFAPWEYENDAFVLLCEICHDAVHGPRKAVEEDLIKEASKYTAETLALLVAALKAINQRDFSLGRGTTGFSIRGLGAALADGCPVEEVWEWSSTIRRKAFDDGVKAGRGK